MKEKIELMLKIYRERLDKASKIGDYLKCVELNAQIGILELLHIYSLEEIKYIHSSKEE